MGDILATSLGGGSACNLSDWMVLGATGDAKVIIWNVSCQSVDSTVSRLK